MFADRSEVDLNERLNLARKNSNIAAYSPAKPPRSPLNGLLPVNTAMPTRGDATPKSPGFSLRPSPLDSPSEDTPVARRKAVSEDPTESLRQASKSIPLISTWTDDQYDADHLFQYPLPLFEFATGHLLLFEPMPLSRLGLMVQDRLLDHEGRVSGMADRLLLSIPRFFSL
jgi:hypothetical protein